MIEQDQLDRIDEIIARARAAGNTGAVAKAVGLLVEVIKAGAPDADEADPMARARARARPAPRTGQDRCTATTRRGEECQAPAVAETLVCRRHGGSAPQVRIAAQRQQLQMALYSAGSCWEEARGGAGEFDALCRWSRAERELAEFEVKARLVRELRAELRRRRAARGTGGAA